MRLRRSELSTPASIEGKMIDVAVIRNVRNVIKKADQIGM
jgi:citrate lyase beta subunit